MKNHERKNRRFNNWFSSTFYSIFVKNLEVFAKFSKIRHICVGLRTSRLLVYLLGRHYYQCLTWLFIMTSLSDVSISISDSYAKQPNGGERTKLWASNKVIFRQKSDFKQKINFYEILRPKMTKLQRNCIKKSLCTQNSWFLLRNFRRKFLLELNFCVVNSAGCFLPPKNQER